MTDDIKTSTESNTTPQPSGPQAPPPPQTPEQRNVALYEQFRSVLVDNKVQCAVAAMIDPVTGKPEIFVYGHLYNGTRLACDLARKLKDTLNSELSV